MIIIICTHIIWTILVFWGVLMEEASFDLPLNVGKTILCARIYAVKMAMLYYMRPQRLLLPLKRPNVLGERSVSFCLTSCSFPAKRHHTLADADYGKSCESISTLRVRSLRLIKVSRSQKAPQDCTASAHRQSL